VWNDNNAWKKRDKVYIALRGCEGGAGGKWPMGAPELPAAGQNGAGIGPSLARMAGFASTGRTLRGPLHVLQAHTPGLAAVWKVGKVDR
jgi:hypothetical protein